MLDKIITLQSKEVRDRSFYDGKRISIPAHVRCEDVVKTYGPLLVDTEEKDIRALYCAVTGNRKRKDLPSVSNLLMKGGR